MKTLRSLTTLLSKIVWTGVLVLVLFAASVILCLTGHQDLGIISALWAVLVTQIRIANQR